MADNMLQVVRQEEIEQRFNRKLIDGRIREFVENDPGMVSKALYGIQLLEEYRSKTYSYASKDTRIAQLKDIDLESLVIQLFVGIAYCQLPTLFTSITAQLAGRIGMDDKRDSIITISEMLAILCATDAFDIERIGKFGSLKVISRIPLPNDVIECINNSLYLPPMVCEPLELTSNYSSGYLSHKDSVILGKGNHHDGDVCLDVLNLINKTPLKLDMEFLCELDEDPKTEFTIKKAIESALKKGKDLTEAEASEKVQKQIDNWHRFKGQSQQFYLLMHRMGNEFYLTNKVDKRGRIYCSGYHISTQGTAYKKAMVELAQEELIEGCPTK